MFLAFETYYNWYSLRFSMKCDMMALWAGFFSGKTKGVTTTTRKVLLHRQPNAQEAIQLEKTPLSVQDLWRSTAGRDRAGSVDQGLKQNKMASYALHSFFRAKSKPYFKNINVKHCSKCSSAQ